jgi:hypothetical protein
MHVRTPPDKWRIVEKWKRVVEEGEWERNERLEGGGKEEVGLLNC